MTLHVEFDLFAEAAKRHLKNPYAYISRFENKTHVTAADPIANVMVSASTKASVEEAKEKLISAGLEVAHGGWAEASHGPSDALGELPFIAAVSYKSGDEMPGIWVDAYAELPSPATVLKGIYDEFRQTGEIGDMAFEEFMRLATPNVTIVSPADLERYLVEKGACE